MALLLHVDWWGEIFPMMILCVVIFFFGVAAGQIVRKKGRGDAAGNRAARRAHAAQGRSERRRKP